METFTLKTQFGNIQYKPVNMLNVDLLVAKWKVQNKPPTIPKIRQRWTGTETGKLITLSMKRYGVHANYLASDKKKELRKEIEASLPMVDNPYDKQYLQDKKDYANRAYLVHWQAVINAGIVAGEENERTLAICFVCDNLRDEKTDEETKETAEYKQSTYRYKVYNAIINVSCVTAELVQSCLIALDRYYKGKPFLEVFDNRVEKHDEDIPADAFRHSMDTLFINAGLYEHSKTLPIEERGMLAAMLLSNENMKAWHMDDAKKEALAKGNKGVKNVLVEKGR